jgi:hypothetical protein
MSSQCHFDYPSGILLLWSDYQISIVIQKHQLLRMNVLTSQHPLPIKGVPERNVVESYFRLHLKLILAVPLIKTITVLILWLTFFRSLSHLVRSLKWVYPTAMECLYAIIPKPNNQSNLDLWVSLRLELSKT